MYIFSNLWANVSNWWWPSEPAAVCENILERLSNNQLTTPDFIKPAACLIEDVYRKHGTAAAIGTTSLIGLGIYKGGGFHYLYNRLQSISSDDFMHAVRAILKSQYPNEYEQYNIFLIDLQDAIKQFLPEAIEQRQGDSSNQSVRKAKLDPTLRKEFIKKTVNFITTRSNEFQQATSERRQEIVNEISACYLQANEITPVANSTSRYDGV